LRVNFGAVNIDASTVNNLGIYGKAVPSTSLGGVMVMVRTARRGKLNEI
jgi:hypothetical protein